MDIVADTNIFLAVVLNEPEKERIIELTAQATLIAPRILPYEMGNALSALVKRRQIAMNDALAAEKAAASIPVNLVDLNINAALQLALRHNFYAYDAYSLLCAKTLSLPLLTLDRQMKRVANELAIRILE